MLCRLLMLPVVASKQIIIRVT